MKQKDFIKATEGSGGIQSVVATKLKISRQAVNQYIGKYPKMKELLEKEREKIIDLAENKLFKAADNGEKWAIERILKTIGRSRGYSEHLEIDQKTEVAVSKSARELYNELRGNNKPIDKK